MLNFVCMKQINDKQDFKVGIVGAGWIAEKAAITLNGLDGFRPFTIGSRSREKAQAFADKWGIERAYGSYSEVLDDPEVDLVYVATPHSHHFHVPKQITGYEYQFVACRDAMAAGLTEPPQMPLDETLYIMELMDGLREEWGVRYPMDDETWN